MNYVNIDQIVCTGCEACADSCPTDVIRMGPQSGKAQVVYAEDCQVCFLCEFDCPVNAIPVSPRGWPQQSIQGENKNGIS